MGRQRFCKIGRHGAPWTPDEARKKAREVLVEVANGGDPAGAKYDDRKAATVAQLCDLYVAEGAAGRLLKRGKAKRASTLLADKSNIKHHIVPVLGALKVSSVNRDDVERLRDAITAGKTAKHVPGGSGAATRTLGLLGGVFSFAIQRNMRLDNPVKGVERLANGQRDRRVSGEEYARLGEALRVLSATLWPPAIAATRFLALSGWRRGEALGLKWPEIDLVTRTARLVDTKSGPSMRPLSRAACDLLRDHRPRRWRRHAALNLEHQRPRRSRILTDGPLSQPGLPDTRAGMLTGKSRRAPGRAEPIAERLAARVSLLFVSRPGKRRV
jgi:integrase